MKDIVQQMKEQKQTKPNNTTIVHYYGRFAVCTCQRMPPFIVDQEIADIIRHRSWCLSSGYPCTRLNGQIVRLHEFVMAYYDSGERIEGCFIDHINQDKLDNRVINLRYVTPMESTHNIPLRSNNKSGYTGVSLTKHNSYRAYITVNKQRIELGHYKTVEEAWHARCEAENRFGFETRPITVAEKCAVYGGIQNDDDKRLPKKD